MAEGDLVVPRSALRTGMGAGLLLLGVMAFIVGAALAWGASPLLGYVIGGLGTVALVIGAIMVRTGLLQRIAELGDEGAG